MSSIPIPFGITPVIGASRRVLQPAVPIRERDLSQFGFQEKATGFQVPR